MSLRNGQHGHGGGSGSRGRDDGFGDLFSGGFGLPELRVVAPALTRTERTLESGLEKMPLLLLFLVPASGPVLVASGDDEWLPLHITAHIGFFVVVGPHIGLVVKHTVIQRDRHLEWML